MDEEILSAVRQYMRYVSTGAIIPDRKEYALISQIHDDYKNIRTFMDNKMCIISPIRAIILKNKPENILKITELYAKLGFTKDNYGEDGEPIDYDKFDMNLYLKSTKVVGYMVGFRMETEEKFRIGYSLCMPQDYNRFNKEIGITLAFDDLRLDDANFMSWKQSVRSGAERAIIPQDSDRIYLFPLTIYEQNYRFHERCSIYFCK